MERIADTLSTREAFGQAALALMEQDPALIAIAPDTGKSMGFDAAAARFPERVFNIGIAEQNMVDMAAGAACTGHRAIIGTYAPFLTLRCLEQIRTFVCYPQLPVVMGGAMAGLSGGIEGPTHQALEDIAVMRTLPHMQVIVPADAHAAFALTCQAYGTAQPAYIRLGRYPLPRVYAAEERFTVGRAKRLREGADVAILCCGSMVLRCLEAAQQLHEMGIGARVVDMHTIKPLDEDEVLRAARETRAVVTAEEHSVIGGLGAAVAELLSERLPTPVIRLGVKDAFAESAAQEALMDAYGLAVRDVIHAARRAVECKRREGA